MKQFIYPYIMLKDSYEAAKYYEKVFDGEITYIMWGKDMPDCPEDQLETIQHLQLKFHNNQIYMADLDTPTSDFIHIHLDYPDLDMMTEAFNRMVEGSIHVEKLQERFWGAVFGSIKDRYGVTWQFHYSKPNE